MLLATSPSGDSFVALLESAAKSLNLTTLSTKLLTFAPRLCPGDIWKARGETLVRRVGPLVARLNWLYNAYQVADTVVSAGILSGRVYWLAQYWKKNESFRVCVADGKVSNCAQEFKMEPATLLVGATYKLDVKAFDLGGRATLVPSSIRFTADSTGASVDQMTGLVVASATPSVGVRITARDAPTGAFGGVTLVVDEGKLTPSTQLLTIPSSGSVRLVSTLDQPIISTGVDLEWAISDTRIATLVLPSPRGATSAFITPLTGGSGSVIVNNPVSGRFLRTNFEVGGLAAAIKILSVSCEYTPHPVNRVQSLWTVTGTASGEIDQAIYQVGAFEEGSRYGITLPFLFSCGGWTDGTPGGNLCTRNSGDPVTTTWSMSVATTSFSGATIVARLLNPAISTWTPRLECPRVP